MKNWCVRVRTKIKSKPRTIKMTQGKFSKEEAKESTIALNEIMKAMPKLKLGEFIGHFNDIFLFLTACEKEAPSENSEEVKNG